MEATKTKLGFEYDLEVVSLSNYSRESSLEVDVTTENGCKTFTLTVNNYGNELDDSDISDILSDADYTDVEKWVDSVELSYLVSEVVKLCVLKGKTFSFNLFNGYEAFFKLDTGGVRFINRDNKKIKEIKEWISTNR